MVYNCAEASRRPPVCLRVSSLMVLLSAALRPSLEPWGSLLPDLGRCLTLSRLRGITGGRRAVGEGWAHLCWLDVGPSTTPRLHSCSSSSESPKLSPQGHRGVPEQPCPPGLSKKFSGAHIQVSATCVVACMQTQMSSTPGTPSSPAREEP